MPDQNDAISKLIDGDINPLARPFWRVKVSANGTTSLESSCILGSENIGKIPTQNDYQPR